MPFTQVSPVTMEKFGQNPQAPNTTLPPKVLAPSKSHLEDEDSEEAENRQEEYVLREKATHRYWDTIVTKEPVSEELKKLKDLKDQWYYYREAKARDNARIFWDTVDSYRITLGDQVHPDGVERKKLAFICNKPTAFYWMQSAQRTGASGERCLTRRLIFAAVYHEWFHCYSMKPNIDFGHFVASPIRVTTTGPSTVSEVIAAHRSICTRASNLINGSFGGRADLIIELNPSDQEHYSILHLYQAIVLIVDDYDPGFELDSDGFISLHKVARYQTVLVARTGVEEGLSAPVSLESLKAQSLPLDRPDVVSSNMDIVRVSLATAIQFIVDLEKREGLQIPLEARLCPHGPEGYDNNEQVGHCPEAWADAWLKVAQEHGYDNVRGTHESIRRVQARLSGQRYYEFEDIVLGNHWK